MTAKLRPIAPMNFPDLAPAKVDDAKPLVQWVAPTSLRVDATYQRDLSTRSIQLIRRMIEGFAWNRFKPPIVVQSQASLHIVDGQHTAIAAATLRIETIPVFVVRADTLDERARAFVGHNSDRIVVSSFDIFRALVAAGDADALEVERVCKRAGVRIRLISPSSAIDVGDTAAVGLVRQLVKRRGVMLARQVLQCLVQAKRAPLSGAEIIAAERVICQERRGLDLEAFTAVIRIEGDEGLAKALARAKTQRTPAWRAVADLWLRRLDRKVVA